MQNRAIAETFDTMADLLEIKGENVFRIRAYRNAARTIRGLSQEISEMIRSGIDLSRLAGIGKDLAQKIVEISETGHLDVLDKIQLQLSPGLANLMKIAGLGGKRVAMIYKWLNVTTLEQLENAAKEHKICKLPGFGEKIETSIIDSITQAKISSGRYLLAFAEETAEPIVNYLKATPFIHNIIIAGSFRRRKETVQDIDILVTGDENNGIMESFLNYSEFYKTLVRGETRATAILRSGMQVDIRVVPNECYGSALHYFTGSQAHNIGIRKRGVKRGLKINEYGIFKNSIKVAGVNESDVYDAVGLPFIVPELREDTGEIEAAEKSLLPDLVKINDIKGDLHVHTVATDGQASVEEIAVASKKMGYSYIAITDHSQKMAMAHGLTEWTLATQIEKIDEINERLGDIKILKGIEVDILENGNLDLSNSILKMLDLTVCSIHSRFNLNREQQTERILRAMDNPHFTILAHPTGRLINRRNAYDIDIEKVMVAAKERKKIMEVNSFPDRMDLDASYCRLAKDIGVKVAINTDAHGLGDLKFIKYGVGQARRGWLEASDVVNTLTFHDLKKILCKN